MNPCKVKRESVVQLTDLPNIGKTLGHDLKSIGINHPDQLKGQDPYNLYVKLCKAFGERQDPCMLDVLMSITDFMNGRQPRVWWDYTDERKRVYGDKINIEKVKQSHH